MIDFEIVNLPALAIALFLGAILGAAYFGTLWLSLRRLAISRRPAVLLLVSVLLRMSLLLAGFYLILDGTHWERLLAALFGFITVRLVMTRYLGPMGRISLTPSPPKASS